MFSTLKLIAASAMVALFGGFLLTGVLTTQQADDVVPAAVAESPTPEAVLDGTSVFEGRVDYGQQTAVATITVETGRIRHTTSGDRLTMLLSSTSVMVTDIPEV